MWNTVIGEAAYDMEYNKNGLTVRIVKNSYTAHINGVVTIANTDPFLYYSNAFRDKNIVLGHVYLFVSESTTPLQYVLYGAFPYSAFVGYGIFKATATSLVDFAVQKEGGFAEGEVIDITTRLQAYDLTRMFGAGEEPTSIEEFYERLPEGVDLDAYNEGVIVNMNVDAIKTTGFNQWDEQWEQGTITISNGQDYDSATMIRSVNYIKVMPTTLYFYTLLGVARNATFIYFYDHNFGYLGYVENYNNVRQFTFTTPANCRFIRFVEQSSKIYNHDICINLSHTGYKDGTYEPYETFTRDISWVKKYFQNGMKRAGNVRDEIRWDSSLQKWVAVERVGSNPIDDLAWEYLGVSDTRPFGCFYAFVGNKVPGDDNILCSKYPCIHRSFYADKECFGNPSNGVIYIIDSSFNEDITAFKAAIQGGVLNYELDEPKITPINEFLFYYPTSYGTEICEYVSPSAKGEIEVTYGSHNVAQQKYIDQELEWILLD